MRWTTWRVTPARPYATVDADGQWCLWKNPVPLAMTSPTAEVSAFELDFFTAAPKVGGAAAEDLDALEQPDSEAWPVFGQVSILVSACSAR